MPEELNPTPGLPGELAAMEQALRALQPSPALAGALDRDQVMYEAGHAAAGRAGRRRVSLWQGVCGMLALACAGLALMPRGMPPDRQVVHPQTPGPATSRVEVQQSVALVTGDTHGAARALPGMLALLFPGDGPIRPLTMDAAGWPVVLRDSAHGAGGGSSATQPTLRGGEGLDALPGWQRKMVDGGKRL